MTIYPLPSLSLVPKETEPSFRVDHRAGCVVWEANGLRLFHEPQFRALAAIFAENGWRKHYLALDDAELALTDPRAAVRAMLVASLDQPSGDAA